MKNLSQAVKRKILTVIYRKIKYILFS